MSQVARDKTERSSDMPASKQPSSPQETIRKFKEDLISRGYSTRTADVYATAVNSFLKNIPNFKHPKPKDADDYIRGILDGTGTEEHYRALQAFYHQGDPDYRNILYL